MKLAGGAELREQAARFKSPETADTALSLSAAQREMRQAPCAEFDGFELFFRGRQVCPCASTSKYRR